MFNKFVWDTYLKAGGNDTVSVFENIIDGEYSTDVGIRYAEFIRNLHSNYCPCRRIVEETYSALRHLVGDIDDGFIAQACYAVAELGEVECETNEILQIFKKGIAGDEPFLAKDLFAELSGGIEYYSTFLWIYYPDKFVPYYFKHNFNVLNLIADEFDIDLPSLPKKKDYEGRFNYYGNICKVLHNFRIKNNMSPYELCAFLYDFAPKYIGGVDSYIINDLPEPKSAYFIGGDAKDAFNTATPDEITAWQANPDTRAGDMIVMYRRTPVSSVESVWRSVSIGFNDPFFYYYRCTYISNCNLIRQVHLKELQQDVVFKDVPIVRKNMQGINGIELLPSQYNHLMDMAGADVARLQYSAIDGDESFSTEKDVENKLVKHLIEKLGYSEDDYVQQLRIRVGNHNFKLIPDFVINPVVSQGHYSASFLIEAKLSIPTLSFLEEVKIQARSYAKQLGAKYSVIASKEKVWVMSSKDDYSKEIFSATWYELNDSDSFYELFRLLGKGK